MNTKDFSEESIRKTAFFTGHRFLYKSDPDFIREALFRCLSDAYENGYRRFFCGCALGFDTLAAFQTVRLRALHSDVKLSLAIPCSTQADRWNESDRIIYHRILEMADEKTVLSPVYFQGLMLARNRYMADRSSLCICWLTNARGGTASAVRYAMQKQNTRIINLAVPDEYGKERLREISWNCMFISHSAKKNAVTAPLHLLQDRKLTIKDI